MNQNREAIRYQEIAAFSRGQVEVDLTESATIRWCGLNISRALTPRDVARHFSVSPHQNPQYPRFLRCHLTRVAASIGPEQVAASDSDYRLTGALAFGKTAGLEENDFRFTTSCAGQDFDAAILLFPAQPLNRQSFRQQLQLAQASIRSAADGHDSRNCPLWIDYAKPKAKRKRFFGLW